MWCRRSNGCGSVVKNDESPIPFLDSGTNQHFYIDPVSIRCINAHASRSFSFSDHIHLSLHYDENIGNGIIFSIDVTCTYYMTKFCVFDSFSENCVKNADGARRPVPRLHPNVSSMFG